MLKTKGFWRWGLLSALVLVALLLRTHDLSRVFLWLDETDMFNEHVYSPKHLSLVDFALYTRRSSTITWGWPSIIWIACRLFGATIETARFPTVLLSAAGVLALFCLVYRLIPRDAPGRRYWPALFAALFAAVSVTQLEHAQRTYPYGVIPCLAAAILLAHFEVLRAASPGWKYSPRLLRAVALYAVAASIALCIHASPGLLLAISMLFLFWNAAPNLLRQAPEQRWKVIRLAVGAIAVMGCAALANAKNPKYGFRVYLSNYYPPLSLAAIPMTVRHAYDLATYQLNLFYNPALYWPERLNPLLIPLVLLCILGWSLALAGIFGPDARQLSLMGLAGVLLPAALSFVKMYPFGGVRQTLYLNPFFLTFVAFGFYALRGAPLTRLLGIALAGAYLLVWGLNLPAFYRERRAAYTPNELVDTWKENGSLPVFAWGSERELRYELREHPEISIDTVPMHSKSTQAPPYLLICTHNWIGDDHWFKGYPEYLQGLGYKATLLKQGPLWNLESVGVSGSLYFPPNGLWIYKVTAP